MPFITQGKTNWKFLLIVIILAVIVGGGALLLQLQEQRPVPPTKSINQEQGCINSGGKVTTISCCQSSGDFPSFCMVGACGCSPNNSHEVKACDCGLDKCFNGVRCFSEGVNGDEVANWKTYRSEEYGFEVKYPSNWIYLQNEGASAGLFNIKAPGTSSHPGETISARIFPREGSESNQEYINNLIDKTILPGYMDLLDRKEVISNNLKAYELIWKITDLETNQIYYGPIDVLFETPTENKNRFIALIFSGEVSEENPNLPVFRSILTTFKFLE